MKINTRARYSVRLMCDIETNGGGKPVPLKDTAERTGISRRYLEQLAIPLRSAALLRTARGMQGGYFLARPASEIMIREIIEAADGPIYILDCLVGKGESCERAKDCPTRDVWGEINEGILETLSHYTLGDLAASRKGKCGGSSGKKGKKTRGK